jgi:hypothetical protein
MTLSTKPTELSTKPSQVAVEVLKVDMTSEAEGNGRK